LSVIAHTVGEMYLMCGRSGIWRNGVTEGMLQLLQSFNSTNSIHLLDEGAAAPVQKSKSPCRYRQE
jgi:hypothetical protein